MMRLEAGPDGYARSLVAGSLPLNTGNLLYAADYTHEDGPWVRPDAASKGNAVLRFSRGDAENGTSLTSMAYKGAWYSTDQIAQRAVDAGLSRFGSLDTSDGGDSQRYSLSGRWRQGDENGNVQISAYAFYYDLHLWSNFTYLLNDPVRGDQLEQTDRRFAAGFKASREWDAEFGGRKVANTVGLQVRNDEISNGLFHTQARQTLSVTNQDGIHETSVSPYAENKTIWTDTFRSVAGLRGDVYRMDVRSGVNPADTGNRSSALFSPKLSLIFGPWSETELYLNGGYGFHSNDARGATQHIDATTGLPLSPVTPLSRTVGAEAGVRTLAVSGLQTTLSLWVLKIGSELVYDPNLGSNQPSGPSRRYGVEWANYYTPAAWITLDADASLSRAYFTDSEPTGNYVPDSIQSVVAAGAALKQGAFSGEIRERYFGPRALTQNGAVRSKASSLIYARLGCEIGPSWDLALSVFNLLDERANDIEYVYASRLPGEPAAGVSDIHIHPAEPREFRVILTRKF